VKFPPASQLIIFLCLLFSHIFILCMGPWSLIRGQQRNYCWRVVLNQDQMLFLSPPLTLLGSEPTNLCTRHGHSNDEYPYLSELIVRSQNVGEIFAIRLLWLKPNDSGAAKTSLEYIPASLFSHNWRKLLHYIFCNSSLFSGFPVICLAIFSSNRRCWNVGKPGCAMPL